MGSLGFGQGYAYSQDRTCTLLDRIIKVRGERAKWFGAGENDADLHPDFAYRNRYQATARKRHITDRRDSRRTCGP